MLRFPRCVGTEAECKVFDEVVSMLEKYRSTSKWWRSPIGEGGVGCPIRISVSSLEHV